MSLRHGLLGMINLKPMTGYELDREFKESLKYIWQAKSSQIYNELNKMEQSGWLISERVMQDEKPNKRVYSITEEGKTELMDWMATPEIDVNNALTGKNAFLFRVLLGGSLSKEQALKLLHSFRDVCLVRRTTQEGIRTAIARDEHEYDHENIMFFNLVALHGEMTLKARLEWVEKAITIVENAKV